MVAIAMDQALALMDVVAASRIVVLLDGTDRLSLDELRAALVAYDKVKTSEA